MRRATGFPPGRAVLLAAAGLALRLLLLASSPRFGYFADHDDFVRLGLDTVDHGFLSIYDRPATPATALLYGPEGTPRLARRPYERRFDHPPLLGALIAVSGRLFVLARPDRLVNTFESRLAFGLWNLAADLLLAWGGALLCRRLGGEDAARFAFAGLLFAPPLLWGSTMWGQLDAPVLALSLLMVLALADGRPVRAGVLLGLLVALKPQALFFAPGWALVLATPGRRGRSVVGLAAGLLTLALVSLPYTLHSGLSWFRASWGGALYRVNDATTLHAFNVWSVDLLLGGSRDPSSRLLGLSKAAWGLLLLGAALAAAVGLALRRWRGEQESRGLLLLTAASLLLCVLLPTGIHERYVQYPLAFLIVVAALHPRLVTGVAVLSGAALAQLAWPLWLRGPLAWQLSALVTATTLAAAAVVLSGIARLSPEGE